MWGIKIKIIFFDTETTGLDFRSCKIIELAMLAVENGEIIELSNEEQQFEYRNSIFDEETVKSLLKSEEDIEKGRTRNALEVITELLKD